MKPRERMWFEFHDRMAGFFIFLQQLCNRRTKYHINKGRRLAVILPCRLPATHCGPAQIRRDEIEIVYRVLVEGEQ